jgi:uncharacterized membrane protein
MSNYESKISQATIDAYTSGEKKINGSIGQYFSKGWEIFQKDMGGNFLSGVVLVFLNVVGPFMQSGYFMGLYEERTGGTKMEMGQMFKGFDLAGKIVWHYIVSMVAGFAIVFIAMPVLFLFMMTGEESMIFLGMGMFYLVLFGLLIAMLAFLLFAIYLMTFSKLDGMGAIKASVAIARQNLGKVMTFAILMFIFQLIGAMMCYVGAFVAYPVSVIALYLFCNDIFSVEEGNDDDIIEHLVD